MQKDWREKAAWVRATPWEEIRLRLRQEVAKRFDRAVYALGLNPSARELKPSVKGRTIPSRQFLRGRDASAASQPRSESGSTEARSDGQFFFSPQDVQPVLSLLHERFPDECGEIVEQAERLCRHQFDLLGFQNINYGIEIDWHLDPIHQKRSPRRPWYQIQTLESCEAGDRRIIFEINRHQHLVTLAEALLLQQEPRYLAELVDQWRGWQKENRYPIGINWSSGHEVALRSLAWLWVGHLLSASPLAPKSFQHELLRGLAQNGRHIERFLQPNAGSQIGEATGLFFIGTLCPRLRSAPRWRELGWRMIQNEAQKQVQADGLLRDESVYYHVHALDFFLHARILAGRNQMPIPESLDRTIVQMIEFLAGVSQGGSAPRFGDDDGGRVFDPRRNRREHMLDPLSIGAALYECADFKSTSPGLTEETLWLLGPDGVSRFDAIPGRQANARSIAFRESGLYVVTGGPSFRRATDADSLARPGQLVIRAGQSDCGAHGHDDALSVELSAGGEEWLIDPGTFTYAESGAPMAAGYSNRERYRGAAAHNTLTVDGVNPVRLHNATGTGLAPSSDAALWITGRQFDLFRGTARGYQNLANPVVHERWVFLLKSKFWLVRDVALGTGVHELEICWHFAPDFTPSYTPPGFTLNRQDKFNSSGPGHAGLAIVPAEGHGWSQEVRRGYVSPVYGVEEPAAVVCFRTEARLPAELAVVLTPSGAGAGSAGKLKRDVAAGVACYRYGAEGVLHFLFFPGTAGQWECGGWRSDARFVYLGATPHGGSLALVGGSFLSFRGHPVLISDRPLGQCEVLPGERQVYCPDPQASIECHDLDAALEASAADFSVRQP